MSLEDEIVIKADTNYKGHDQIFIGWKNITVKDQYYCLKKFQITSSDLGIPQRYVSENT